MYFLLKSRIPFLPYMNAYFDRRTNNNIYQDWQPSNLILFDFHLYSLCIGKYRGRYKKMLSFSPEVFVLRFPEPKKGGLQIVCILCCLCEDPRLTQKLLDRLRSNFRKTCNFS